MSTKTCKRSATGVEVERSQWEIINVKKKKTKQEGRKASHLLKMLTEMADVQRKLLNSENM